MTSYRIAWHRDGEQNIEDFRTLRAAKARIAYLKLQIRVTIPCEHAQPYEVTGIEWNEESA